MKRHLTALLTVCLWATTSAAATRPVTVSKMKQDDGSVAFRLYNQKPFPVTLTWEFTRLENLAADVSLPHTILLMPHTTAHITARVIEAQQPVDWGYRLRWNTGPNNAAPDAAYPYKLPFVPGSGYPVLQAFHGTFSHTGPEQFCVDWSMPEGTPVTAARDGLVMNVESGFSERGGWEARAKGNYVRILHTDGTVGVYLHFQKDGIRVAEGQQVQAGEILGLSGNTGFSTEPHLHFGVFRVVDGGNQESIPILFTDGQDSGLTLIRGNTYRLHEPSY